MNVMKMKEITELLSAIGKNGIPSNSEELEKTMDRINSVVGTLGDEAQQAKEIITAKMPERDLVEFFETVQKVTVFGAAANGDFGMMMAMASGELTSYTHSVILATIGALINEEIL